MREIRTSKKGEVSALGVKMTVQPLKGAPTEQLRVRLGGGWALAAQGTALAGLERASLLWNIQEAQGLADLGLSLPFPTSLPSSLPPSSLGAQE